MKTLIMKLRIKLGLYKVVKYIHKYNPIYNVIASMFKAKIKKTKSIKVSDLDRWEVSSIKTL